MTDYDTRMIRTNDQICRSYARGQEANTRAGLGVPCDICSAEATTAARDIRELAPVATDTGLWSAWAAAGSWRFGCTDHPPRRTRYHLRRQGDKVQP